MNASPTDPYPGHDGSKKPDPLGKDTPIVIVLIILAVAVAALWLADPSHRPDGESRVGWPDKPGVKP